MEKLFPQLDQRARNMGEMMRICGVDPALFACHRLGQTMAAASRSCIVCAQGTLCRQWLEAADRSGLSDPPSFCPNADRFRKARLH